MIGEGGKTALHSNDVPRNFRKVGLLIAQRYHRMEDQKPGPWLACYLGLAERVGFEQKLKCFSKMSKNEIGGEQTNITQAYHRRVWG